MNLTIQQFEGRAVRMAMIDGEPWWVLKDVCEVLGLTTPARVAERLESDEVSQTHFIDSIGRKQETIIINESGLYSVILRSDKPEARRFRKWVTSEVLPSIRKTGGYNHEAPKGPHLLALAVLEAAKMIEEKDKEIARLEPLAEVAERIASAAGLKSLREIGKINGIGPNKIFEVLEDRKILYRENGCNVPYQKYIDSGYFKVRETTYMMNGVEILYSKVFVTGKGEAWLARQLFPSEAV